MIPATKKIKESVQTLVHDLYSDNDELASSLTHGLGMLLSVTALTLMIVLSANAADAARMTSSIIYGASLVLLYLMSTIYHLVRSPKVRRIFQILDHCAIYLLIAGTYTPFLLISLEGVLGYSLLVIIWGLALFGIVFKTLFTVRFEKVSLFTYLAMGWLIIVAIGEVVENVATGGLSLLIAGGLMYTLGTIFFVWERIPFNHAIWHLFVLAGSTCHFFAIYLYVLPVVESSS